MTKQAFVAPASDPKQSSVAGQPADGRRQRKRGRSTRTLIRCAVTASVASIGLTAMALGEANAYADTLSNGPSVHLGQYSIPTTAPAYVNGGDLLPLYNGTLGDPAALVLTGSAASGTADTDVVQIPGNSSNWGTQLATGAGAQAPGQSWYFQRVGYIDVNTPVTSRLDAAGASEELATPVYMIINYNPGGTLTCLEGWGGHPSPGSVVDSYGCNPNQVDQTNQLWIVGSPAQSNNTANSVTGAFDGGSAPQVFTTYLQGSGSGTSDLQDSVIENVASLAASGWNTAQAPVLSADASNAQGINSELTLQSQSSTASTANSTWNIVPTSAAPGSSGSDDPPMCYPDCDPAQILPPPTGPSPIL